MFEATDSPRINLVPFFNAMAQTTRAAADVAADPTRERIQRMEERSKQLTRECEEIKARLSATGARDRNARTQERPD